jgi:hypothetical protein
MDSSKEEQFKTVLDGLLNTCINFTNPKRKLLFLNWTLKKAFDLVEHKLVLEMLRAKGFPDKWLAWVDNLFNTATSSVLLNGTAGKEFKCLRGVRQGDLLSHLLFAIVTDLLRSVINHEYSLGNLIPLFLRIGTSPFLLCNMLMILFL